MKSHIIRLFTPDKKMIRNDRMVVKMMKNKTEKEAKKIKETIVLLESRNEGNALDEAKRKSYIYNNTVLIMSICGPILLAVISILFPWELSWSQINNYLNIGLTVILVLALCYITYQCIFYGKVVSFIEQSKENLKKENDALKKKIKTLQHNKDYYISTAEHLGRSINSNKSSIEALAQVMIASIYNILSDYIEGDNCTLNIYEVNKGILNMITSFNRSKYVTKEEDLDNPFIYMQNGIDIRNAGIQEYYCVRCINGRKDWYVLDDWKKIAKEFKWNKWGDEETKNKIISENDREACLQLGFNYNQYMGIRWRHNKDILWYLEILTNKDTAFVDIEGMNKNARIIRDDCCPMIDIIWDIAHLGNAEKN